MSINDWKTLRSQLEESPWLDCSPANSYIKGNINGTIICELPICINRENVDKCIHNYVHNTNLRDVYI